MYMREYDSAVKKYESMPFAATWMDLENIILTKVRQRQTSIIQRFFSYITFMWNINELTYKSETDPQTFKGRRDKLSILD